MIRDIKFGVVYLLAILLLPSVDSAQTIPSVRQADWINVGVIGGIPAITKFVNITNYGAVSGGVADNTAALNNAIAALGGNMGLVLIPKGTWFFGSSISVPSNVIIKGRGSDSTILVFNNGGGNCFNVQGSLSAGFTALSGGYTGGSRTVSMSSTAAFNIDDYVLINQTNGAYNTVPATWAVDYVGQVLRVVGQTSTTLSFDKPLRYTYNASLNPKTGLISAKQYVGFEGFKIMRTETMAPTSATGHFFHFTYSGKCWVRAVEMQKTAYAAVAIEGSKNIEVTGCYIHHAYNYDGGGTRGYGIMFGQWTSDCLAENNCGDSLRHFIMFKQGANGNVAGYNYHYRTYRNGSGECFPAFGGLGCDAAADISLHGHYPYANLVEGHIGRFMSADQSWGPNGPYNTLFRNRTNSSWGVSVLSGTVNSDSMNITGNRVVSGGSWSISGSNHIICSNDVNGTIRSAACSSGLENSLYYTQKPQWWPSGMIWPSTGADIAAASNTNPAYNRFISAGIKTYLYEGSSPTGSVRFNSSLNKFEGYNGRIWVEL